MTVRTRITLISALAMTALAVLVAAFLFVTEARDLRGQVDIELTTRAESVAAELRSTGEVDSLLRPPFGEPVAYVQLVGVEGNIIQLAPGFPNLPVGERELAVAAGEESRFFTSTEVDTVHVRVLTIPFQPGIALQAARPVDAIDLHVLRFGVIAFLVALSASAIGVLLARFVARSALKPVAELTKAAQLVASTRDLAHRIQIAGDSELIGLAESMNSMVSALDEALTTQQQLVADASHELQTPITVLRTNVSLLANAHDMPAEERRSVLDDMARELVNLSRLATNLVDLARNPTDPTSYQVVAVNELIDEMVSSARRTYPSVRFDVEVDELEVRCDPDQMWRMVRNLIDNAAEWTGEHANVEVGLRDGMLSVRDFGPGIAPKDMPHLFERFYRASSARSMPGSGLGLAIVAKACDEHGWEIDVDNAEGGGAIFRVLLNGRAGEEQAHLHPAPLRGLTR